MQHSAFVKEMRQRLRILINLPARDNARDVRWFVFGWLWSIAGVVPGVLLAAVIIGRFRITDEMQQNAVSISCAFASILLTNAIIAAAGSAVPRLPVFMLARAASARIRAIKLALAVVGLLGTTLLAAAGIFGPFIVAFGAMSWYSAHGATAAGLAARGSVGALALKAAMPLWKVVVLPALRNKVTGKLGKRLRNWVNGAETEPSGA